MQGVACTGRWATHTPAAGPGLVTAFKVCTDLLHQPGDQPRWQPTLVTALYATMCVQVACTCLGTSHPMLKGQEFDCCILDEAGQMTLPASLGPLLKARAGLLFALQIGDRPGLADDHGQVGVC